MAIVDEELRTPARFLTLTEAAARSGHVSPETLYRLARRGVLPVRRIGRKVVISERLYDAWVDSSGDVQAAGAALAGRS